MKNESTKLIYRMRKVETTIRELLKLNLCAESDLYIYYLCQ